MIELKDVYVQNRDWEAARGVSARLPNGRVYGVISSAEGDSARLLAAMAGTCSYAGQIKINGYDLSTQGKKARACLGYLPEGAPLDPSMTPVEALELAAQAKGMPYERAVKRINEILDLVGLEEIADRLAQSMSETDKRFLSLAQALIGDGDILLLTDPVKGLGKEDAEELFDVLRQVKEKRTVFISSDAMEGLPLYCDTVFLLDHGEWIESPDKELTEPLMKRKAPVSGSKKAPHTPKKDGEYEVIEGDDA